MKYLRHFPLAFWALTCLVLGGVIALAQVTNQPTAPTRSTSATVSLERSNVMALLTHLATVHAAAAPPATGLAQWGVETAGMAQSLADRRAVASDDRVVAAYREVAAAAAGLASVDPLNREQILSGIAALGAAGNRLGASVSSVELPPAGSLPAAPTNGPVTGSPATSAPGTSVTMPAPSLQEGTPNANDVPGTEQDSGKREETR
jgi:hypothetical protein